MKTQENQTDLDLDSHGDPLMTTKTIKALCLVDGLPLVPELNDKLYLYEKGFRNILPLNLYENLISLWLNKNKIVKIENLEGLKNLMCLYLQDNLITKIEGLDFLSQLEILNLERNKIPKVQNLGNLHKLKNLNLAENYLSTYQSISELSSLKKITNLDISKNQIQNSDQIIDLMKELSNLSCLSLKATPFARGFKNYRKNLIAILPSLKFLDDRPIQQSQHRLCEAWVLGGVQQQKKMRNKIQTEQKQSKKKLINEAQSQQKIVKLTDPLIISQSVVVQMKSEKKVLKEKVEKVQIQSNEKNVEPQQVITEQLPEIPKNKTVSSWNIHYEKILEALLQKYQFDFSEVQPRFNMIISQINKKLMRPTSRFQIDQLEKVWTELEVRKRKEIPLI